MGTFVSAASRNFATPPQRSPLARRSPASERFRLAAQQVLFPDRERTATEARRFTVTQSFIVIRRFDVGMHLPYFVRRQAIAEGRHLRAFAAVDDDLEESFVA